MWKKLISTVILLFTILSWEVVAEQQLQYKIVFTQEPYELERHRNHLGWSLQKFAPEGSRIVALSPDGAISVLTPEFTSACNPAVSYNGKQILFAGKRRRQNHWNIWLMDIYGRNKRKITNDLGDCFSPEYLARGAITPPEFTDKVRWITFTSNAAGTYDEHGEQLATSLYVTNIEPIKGRGFIRWRTTFNLSSDFSPTVLSDGRVIFSSCQYHGNRYYPNGMVALMVMNWAGTGLNLFYGNHQGPALKTMACEMPDRTIVFVESDGTIPDGSGRLARVSFRRPLHSHEVLSKEVPSGRYRTPHAFPNGELVVSYAPPKGSFGIYVFDYKTGMPGRKIYDDPRWNDVDAMAITPRPEPQGRIPIVVDSLSTGYLQCLNVYDSDRKEALQVKHGDVKWVRLVEGVPISRSEQERPHSIMKTIEWNLPGIMKFVKTRMLGVAPVEPDGSFYVKVPADTPFFIQTLDENGMAVETMRSWMWVRRGSRRGCIGCHENKELTSENSITEALIKAHPTSLTTPPQERRAVDFRHDVMPIVKRHCVRCHGKKSPPKGLKLTLERTKYFNHAYENLLAPSKNKSAQGGKYICPLNARKSLLIQLLYGWKEHTNGRIMPPDKPLTEMERKTFVEWIDLGAVWDKTRVK